MNKETKAPSLITKWVETKDYKVEFYLFHVDFRSFTST